MNADHRSPFKTVRFRPDVSYGTRVQPLPVGDPPSSDLRNPFKWPSVGDVFEIDDLRAGHIRYEILEVQSDFIRIHETHARYGEVVKAYTPGKWNIQVNRSKRMRLVLKA